MTKVSQTQLITEAKAGNVVSFPTDTVPALAALPEKSHLIFALKQRPQNKPLILMGATPDDLWPYVRGSVEEKLLWLQVTQQHWPGALTLVLPASSLVPAVMNSSDPHTIGLRVPAHAVARAILTQTGPLATTSANLSGQPPLETMSGIAATFAEVFVLDCCENEGGSSLPSTVAKWVGQDWKILRQGSVLV